MSNSALDFSKFGGRLVAGTAKGGFEADHNDAWDFGYVLPHERTKEQQEVHVQAVSRMPDFAIQGSWNDDPELVGLWDFSKLANGGKHFNTFYQQTGSCVGNGLGQVVWRLSSIEVVRLKDPEQVILPFYLLPYGRSRLIGGMRGQGEGSFGSAAAEAIRVDGILPANLAGLPSYQDDPDTGITWGRNAEMIWSDGARIDEKWLQLSRKHVVKSTAQCRSADDVWEAISNGYPCTCASDWGGMMNPRVQDGVLLNSRVTTWNHQMGVHGRMRHKTLGKLFYILNSWGPKTHGICPSGAQPGGFWIKFGDMDYIARQGETFAMSQFENGFPAANPDYYL